MEKADFHAVEYLSTPCQFCAKLCTSDCSKSGLIDGLDRITCPARIFPCYNNIIILVLGRGSGPSFKGVHGQTILEAVCIYRTEFGIFLDSSTATAS